MKAIHIYIQKYFNTTEKIMNQGENTGTLYVVFMTTQGAQEMQNSSAFAAKLIEFAEHIVDVHDKSYPQVHAEIMLNGISYSAVGGSEHCVQKYRIHPAIKSMQCFEFVGIPISDTAKLQSFLNLTVTTRATYTIPFVDFVLPKVLLDYMDPDVPCDQPFSWPHLYCSQYVLLVLRYCAKHEIIPLSKAKLSLIDSDHVNSHACSPAHLRHILHNMLSTP
jgi:hypothetical protein